MNKVLSNKSAILIFMLPAIIFFILIIVVPVVLSGYYSTLEWNGFGEKIFIGFENYKDLFVNNMDGFPNAVKNSFLFMIVSVFIQLPISLLFALILAKGIKGENFFRTVFFVPVILSTVVIGQLWLKIYHPDYGLLNTILTSMGLDKYTHAWLGVNNTALIATFIPILWQYIGYHMLLMYASIKNISPDIYEAAKIDGANSFKTATKITIPLIVPTLKVSTIFSITGSLKVFDLIFILTNGGPAGATEVPSTLMVKSIFMSNKYGYGSAMAIFIVIECFIFVAIVGKAFGIIEKKYF